MKSILLKCICVLSITVATGLAGSPLAQACQSGFLHAVAVEYVATNADVNSEFSRPTATPTPQYPIRLIGYDGSTYTYQSDCCQQDGHTGLIYSRVELSNLGCGAVGSVGVEGVEIAVAAETFGVQNAGQTVNTTTICMHSSFADLSQAPFKPVSSFGDAGSFSDYYGGRSSAATAVQLTGNESVSRYYTLMRMETFGDFTTKGASAAFRYELPILFLARTTATRNVNFGDGRPRDITPEKTVVVSDALAVDLTAPVVQVVTIKLPNPETGELQDVQCLLVNRKVE